MNESSFMNNNNGGINNSTQDSYNYNVNSTILNNDNN